MTFEHYDATVRGIIWDGGKAWTTYRFDHRPTRQEVISCYGDFQKVTDVSLKRTTTTIEKCEFAA